MFILSPCSFNLVLKILVAAIDNLCLVMIKLVFFRSTFELTIEIYAYFILFLILYVFYYKLGSSISPLKLQKKKNVMKTNRS